MTITIPEQAEVMYLVRYSVPILKREHYALFRTDHRAHQFANELNRQNRWAGAIVTALIVNESIEAVAL